LYNTALDFGKSRAEAAGMAEASIGAFGLATIATPFQLCAIDKHPAAVYNTVKDAASNRVFARAAAIASGRYALHADRRS